MKTISLRYTDKFATSNGTIEEHKRILKEKGFVWYGKMGAPISEKVAQTILDNPLPRFLLIHSGFTDRYWIHIDKISRVQPSKDDYPSYYHEKAEHIGTWFRVISITEADRSVMSRCKVASSGAPLSEVSRHSMNPYFIIEYQDAEV